jgi:23S rRNA pseudouridine955/2504/2580 synthase
MTDPKYLHDATYAGAGPRLVEVEADSVGRRLDNFLISALKGLPRSRVYRMIRSGEVRVNKGRSKPSYHLAAGDVVRIPPVRGLEQNAEPFISPGRADWLNACVIFEDEYLLVLNKPSGLAVHGGSGVSLGAIELLRAARPDCRYLELVHRLDRDTSGCLLVAKKRSSLRELHAQFRDGQVEKIYYALLTGRWKGSKREVALPLVTEHREGGERHVRTGADGKPAVTRFFPQRRYDDAVFMEVELLTGRTHQIRVHAAAIGHPVAGDERYGSGIAPPAGLRRLFLHAGKLGFNHPGNSEFITVEAPLDADLRAVLERMDAGSKIRE